MLDLEGDATNELRGADERLAGMTEALLARGFSPVSRRVYRDEHGDGTGDMGWLWLRADPPLHPQEPHDCVVRYSAADDNWQVSSPGRAGGRPIPGSNDTATVAALIADEMTRSPEASAHSGAIDAPVVRDLPEWVALILGGVATSVVLPFVQGLVGKSTDDAYASLRSRLRGSRGAEPAPVAAPPTEYLSVLDPETDLHLVVPDPVPASALRQLAAMDRTELRGRTLVWDASREEWFPCRRA
ncbi:hypothetical protein J7E99_21110 [Streptomyces sp. ISL-44]|uniref:hypothetical protein n=1 Tax=Streptomyces sp. ISL-44 TaxID=2819184 RepID=UPI001BE52A07|nr:hypothetical protein [Streptomyces sp. ISL-44]MBT2543130.1 hypothetical protein [Streptomyces sp. ISL-44]